VQLAQRGVKRDHSLGGDQVAEVVDELLKRGGEEER
jgi:hypothetical protein